MELLAFKLDQMLATTRSPPCEDKIKVRFHNFTDYTVDLLWVDFSGKPVRYILLRKNQFVDIDTYVHHYWVAVDVHTGDPMHIAKQLVYSHGELLKQHNLQPFRVPQYVRVTLGITLPVYSLRYRSMLEIRDTVAAECDVDVLEIPVKLGEGIKKLIGRKEAKGMKPMS